MELEKLIPLDAMRKRSDDDLESISIGSDSKLKIKVYYNSKIDTEEMMLPRIDMAIAMANYAKNEMKKRDLI